MNRKAKLSRLGREPRVPLFSTVVEDGLLVAVYPVLVKGSAETVAAGKTCPEAWRTWEVMVAFGRTSVRYPCALVSVVEDTTGRTLASIAVGELSGRMTKSAVYVVVFGLIDEKRSMLREWRGGSARREVEERRTSCVDPLVTQLVYSPGDVFCMVLHLSPASRRRSVFLS